MGWSASVSSVGQLAFVSSVISLQSLIFVAVDRFTAVVFSLRASVRSTKNEFFFILATWFSAMVICSPLTFGVKLVGEVEKT